ncbi:MAG: hypothetical protein H0T41_14980 [Rhodobacteraceae bacterium]|nr:hypothetical protein [Paracoccaceae bacterium]
MILPLAFAFGALIGWVRAGRRGGDRLDRLQYAAAHGILLTLAALVLTILVRRFLAT